MATKTVGIVGYEGVNALDFTGPHEVFTSSYASQPDGTPAYRVLTLSPDGRPYRSRSGLLMTPDLALADAPPLDTLLIPGGTGIRAPAVLQPLGAFVRARAGSTRRLVSVCTGLFG